MHMAFVLFLPEAKSSNREELDRPLPPGSTGGTDGGSTRAFKSVRTPSPGSRKPIAKGGGKSLRAASQRVRDFARVGDVGFVPELAAHVLLDLPVCAALGSVEALEPATDADFLRRGGMGGGLAGGEDTPRFRPGPPAGTSADPGADPK
ncbi:MAG: hypothetical protein RMJ16_04930 [Thermoguttaceae bacterium]|nr:hypothetical protein [Thermoguttaceae bacterium]